MFESDRRRRLIRACALLLLTVVDYVAPWRGMGSAAAWVGLPVFLVHFILLPGWILYERLKPNRRDAVESLTGTFLAGLGYFLAVAFAAALFRLGLKTFGHILPIAVLAPLALDVRPAPAQPPKDAVPLRGGAAVWTALIVLIAAGIFVLTLRGGVPTDITKDTLDHVGYVDEIADSGRLFPQTAVYAQGGDDGRDIRKGLLHVFYGTAHAFLGIDTLRLFDILNAVLAVIILLAVYGLSIHFFADRRVGVLAVALFLLGAGGGFAGPTIRTSFYPNRFGIVFFFYFLAAAVRFVEKKDRRDLVPAAFFAFAACATHVFFAIVIVCAGLVIELWKTCFPRDSVGEHFSRVAVLGLATAAGVLPYAIFRYVTASPRANDLHTEVQGVVFLTPHLFIADPITLARWFGPIGFLSFLTIFSLWRDRGRFPGLGYLLASMLTVPLVLLNPVVLPPLHHVMTYLVFRLNVLSPFFVLAAFFIVGVFDDFGAGARPGRWRHVLTGFLLIAAAAALRPLVSNGTFSPAQIASERSHGYAMWRDGLSFLRALPPPVVVASDPATSYAIPALTPHHVVSTLDQHAPPNDLRLEERIADARDIMSPYVSMARTLALMDRHGATHVVVNRRAPNVPLHYWSADAALAKEIQRKFAAYPALFEKCYDEDDFVVFRRTGGPGDTPPDGIAPVHPFLARIPGGYRRIGRPAGEAVLEAVRLAGDAVPRGGTVAIDLVWSGGRHYRLASYVVAVRLDHTAPNLPLGGKPFPKPARKLKERLTGRRYRLRDEHKIGGGLRGPDTWRKGALVPDGTRVAVPGDMVPGTYRVSVKLLTVTNQPNYRLHDLFFDDDVFEGIEVGRVVIR